MVCACTGWTRARQRRQWVVTAAAALAVGSCGGGGTAGSRHGSHGRAGRVQGPGQLEGQILPVLRNYCCSVFQLQNQQKIDLGKFK